MSHRELLSRAHAGLAALGTLETEYLAGHPYRLLHQQDMRAGRYTVRVEVAHAIPIAFVEQLDLVVRDLRAALDALARALTGSTQSAIRFPIHESLHAFAQRARKPLAPMSDEAQATIEELQPYHVIGGFQRDQLWLMDALLIAPGARLAAGAVTGGTPLGVNTCRGIELSGDLAPVLGPFESGVLIASAVTRIVGADPKIDMYLRPIYSLAFAANGPARGAEVHTTITAIVQRVEECIRKLAPEIPSSR